MSDTIYRDMFKYWEPTFADAGRGDVVTVPVADLKHAAAEIELLRLELDNAKAAIEQARDALAGWGDEDE